MLYVHTLSVLYFLSCHIICVMDVMSMTPPHIHIILSCVMCHVSYIMCHMCHVQFDNRCLSSYLSTSPTSNILLFPITIFYPLPNTMRTLVDQQDRAGWLYYV